MSEVESEVSAAALGRGEWVRLCWGFFWRGMLVSVASTLGGGLGSAA